MERVIRIEQTVNEGMRLVEKKLETGQNFLQILDDGLRAYRDNLMKQTMTSRSTVVFNQWFEKLRTDKSLRFPHRKILEVLLGEYDFIKNEFREMTFSKLVKAAHVAKGAANSYLSFLEAKGYVQRREDGYRKFAKIHDSD